MKTISDKLRDIARWLDEGREIEQSSLPGLWVEWTVKQFLDTDDEYRAKPVKPDRLWTGLVHRVITDDFIQLTSEVREALKQGGIEL